MNKQIKKQKNRLRRKYTVRKKVSGTSDTPRLSVYRSNKHLFAQLIDDEAMKTIIGLSDIKLTKGSKIEKAKETGLLLAQEAKKLKITKVVFDRNGYLYHGRIKSLADGAREGGLIF